MIPKDKLASMPKLGFGFMRLPIIGEDRRNIDLAKVTEMADAYLASGMNYFDTAHVYHKGQSECALRDAVVKRYPRDSFMIADKLSFSLFHGPDDAERILAEAFANLGTDYLDFYLLHCLTKRNIETADKYDLWSFMRRLKAEGRTRYIGVSFHDSPAILEALLAKHHEMLDFVQLMINYYDWDGRLRAGECHAIARKYDLPIIAVEPVRGGSLVNLPQHATNIFRTANPGASNASWAIRYTASKPGVMTVLSGMSDISQVLDNVSYMKDFKPFSKDEHNAAALVARVLSKIELIPCTACRYCADCPKEIDIPFAMSVWNEYRKDWKYDVMKEKIAGMKAAPSSCVECGRCEVKCPQKINIIETLKLV